MATKLQGGGAGVKALVAGPLKKDFFLCGFPKYSGISLFFLDAFYSTCQATKSSMIMKNISVM